MHSGQLLVVAPPLVSVGLRQRREPLRPLRVRAFEDGESGFGRHEIAYRDRRRVGIEFERLAVGFRWGGTDRAANSRS